MGIWEKYPEVNIGLKRDENDEYIGLHNEKQNIFYLSLKIGLNLEVEVSKVCSRMGYVGALWKFNKQIHGKRPLKGPKRRWQDNFRINLEYTVTNMRNWMASAQDKN